MAGLYIHIPFCKSRCIYCDFYSTTRVAEMADYVSVLCQEIRSRCHELVDDDGFARVRTIYIGGGTPSLLSPQQLARIFKVIHDNYVVEADAEVTVEMNPEDSVNLAQQREINRISLGIQTFDNDLLRFLRRRHSAERAVEAVRVLQKAGIRNISIDLIYGLPGQTLQQWEHDLDVAFSLGVQHLSAYALSYESGTQLWQLRQHGRVEEVADELSVEMYRRLCERARKAGFEHYEISNFALPGYHSRHNSSYWTGEAYLGFGPGAHSFDGVRTRRANTPDLGKYIEDPPLTLPCRERVECLEGHSPSPQPLPCRVGSSHFEGQAQGRQTSQPAANNADARSNEITPSLQGRAGGGSSIEILSDSELYDEMVMCGLRTRCGIDLQHLLDRFGQQRYDYLLRCAHSHLTAGRLTITDGHLHLKESALMISDDVMSDLMA